MTTVQRFFSAHLLGAVAALAVGHALGGRLQVSLIIVFIGFIWHLSQRRWATGIENMLLFGFTAAAALGLIWNVPPLLMLLGVVLALGAWDLDHFTQRLHRVERVEFDTGLGRAHVLRLAQVEVAGLVLGMIPLVIRAQIGFWWAILLALLAVIGLSSVVAFVRRETKE